MLTTIVFTVAEIILILSYLFWDIMWLRISSVIGLTIYVIGGFIAGYKAEGMLPLIIFNIIATLINVYEIYKLLLERKPILLPKELKPIYEKTFYIMTPGEFYKFFKIATRLIYKANERIAVQNKPIKNLMMVLHGGADIIVNNKWVIEIGEGFFIGEISFLTGVNANATVQVKNDKLEVLSWDKEDLEKLERKYVSLHGKLKQVISLNLIKKLELMSKPDEAELI